VGEELDTSYKNRTHTNADTTALVWRVFGDVGDTNILTYTLRRKRQTGSKNFDHLRAKGDAQLRSSSVATFNKKLDCMKEGKFDGEMEHDDIPLIDITIDNVSTE
jgi:hypothetical protein